ncbi:hypothetical protein [Eikenella corrodens]|uniref:Uncharacterized protein n=2 Tax=Eikenella TaxID=538 RepID=A0A1A9RK89_EIKCO|nr:hypothetical protein [Eikenella corrodens]OAM19811.1 hypothetical protein A7P90_04925 [Eikenella corrodens]
MQLYQTSGGDLFADAFFILHERLMFASLYGRDANMLSLLARLNKGDQEPISFRLPEDRPYYPAHRTARHFSNLHRRTTKLHTRQYGVLLHTFLYCGELVEPDRDSRSAWVVADDVSADMQPLVWACLNRLSDIPLDDAWAGFVATRLEEAGSLQYFRPGMGSEASLVGIKACRISLPHDFDMMLGGWLKSGQLPPV